VISEIDPEIWVISPCRSRNFMASFLYKFRGELMFCMGITSSQFHPDKILGEMYFTQDFLKGDFCFQNNFTQRAQFRTSHAFQTNFVFGEIRERNWLQCICSYKTQISSSQIRSV